MSDATKPQPLPSKGGSYTLEKGELTCVEEPTKPAPKKRKKRTRKTTRKAD